MSLAAADAKAVRRSGQSLGEALAAARRRLAAAGIDNPGLEARLLLSAATGLDQARLIAEPEMPLPAAARRPLRAMLSARCARAPLAYVLGEKEFWSRAFEVSPEVLVPRPESETVVEAALACAGVRSAGGTVRILDLGTGSGCLLVSLLAELPQASGIGVDRSAPALAVAARNARRHGVAGRARFVCADWLDAIAGRFDLIVANPPYVASAGIATLAPEVARYEPRHALDGGADGLDAYRRIARALPGRLAPGGWVLLEIGEGQAGAVAAMLARAGLDLPAQGPAALPDLAGRPRCVRATLPAQSSPLGKKGLGNGGPRG